MAWFAQVEDSIVLQVMFAADEYDAQWCHDTFGGVWLEAREDASIRGNFPGVGYTYDAQYDVFYAPQPYPSWHIDHTVWRWFAPVPYPDDGKDYRWDEPTLSWVLWGS
jgi:hypothetical protein